MLADFFSILLVRVRFRTRTARSFQGVLFNQGERSFESIHCRGRGRWCKSITVPPLSAGSDSAQMPLCARAHGKAQGSDEPQVRKPIRRELRLDPSSLREVSVRIHLTGFSVCVVLLSCLVASTIHAQSEDVLETREVVVSSTRLPDAPVDARTLPAKVTVITAEDIRKSGAKTVQEAIQWATGIVMYDQVGNAFQQTIDMRGFSGAPVPATSVFVDGVRVNEPDFNSVNFDLVALETIERMEIFPNSSAVFGKNALGGTINITTKRGGETRSVTGETMYGSFNRERSTVTIGGPVGNLDYFSSFSRESEDGYRRDTSANISRFFGKVGYHDGKQTDVTVSYAYVNDKLFQAGQLSLAQLAQDRRQNATPGSFIDNENSFVRVNVRHQLPWGLSLTANLFYRKLTQDSFVNFGGGFSNTTVIETDSRGGVLQLGHELEMWGLKNSLVLGGEFTRNDFNGTSVGLTGSRSLTDEIGRASCRERVYSSV